MVDNLLAETLVYNISNSSQDKIKKGEFQNHMYNVRWKKKYCPIFE